MLSTCLVEDNRLCKRSEEIHAYAENCLYNYGKFRNAEREHCNNQRKATCSFLGKGGSQLRIE